MEVQNRIPDILEFANLKDIKEALGSAAYYSMLSDVEGLTGKKPSLKAIKKYLSNNEVFLKIVVTNAKLINRYRTEGEAFALKKAQSKANKKEANALMKLPKKQYRGCLATRLDTEDYEFCNQDYDNPEKHYERYSAMVPTQSIRQNEYNKAYNRGDEKSQKVLQLDPELTIRDLPRGIRLYMNDHPEKFDAYLEEIKAEQKYLKSIRNSVNRSTPLGKRQAKYEQMYNQVK
jgi:hypothetical protein